MEKFLIGFLIIVTSPLLLAGGQNDQFIEKFYSTVEITKVTKQKGGVDGLSESEKSNLLSAKNTFSDFLENIQKGGPKALEFLSVKLREKYPTSQVLYNEKFGADSLLNYEIVDFNFIDDKKKIEFRYFLTDLTEGTICTNQRSVTLNLQDKEWKISDFEVFSK